MIQHPTRFIALDIHKHYFVAVGIDEHKKTVYGPQRIPNDQLESWIVKVLHPSDAVALEMTTNAYLFYDALVPHVQSVTVVHPPHVALITKAQVKTDRRAALTLAKLLAADLLTGVWIPPQEIRDVRMLVAQQRKMARLGSMAKNRLHSTLHESNLKLPPGSQPFHEKHANFWQNLPVSSATKLNIQSDWETVLFAKRQKDLIKKELACFAAKDDRVPLLVQLPGVGMLTAVTLLAAIGDIDRFASAKKLVGYAGLGARVYESGQIKRSGRITKTGRKDIRYAMVQSANHAVRKHPYWQAQFERLEPRLGRSKTIVAIARRLLVAVWHVLTKECADVHADDVQVAKMLFKHAYTVGVRNLPGDMTAIQFTRHHLDRLKLARDLTHLPWGKKRYKLPPSRLADVDVSTD